MNLLDSLEGVQQKILRPSGGCNTCPRHLVDFVPATLRSGKILWLGEGPGKTEVEMQEGFTGSSGTLLREEAGAAGVPEPWSFSNTVHCRPPNNATPHKREIECCLSQFVLDEVRGYPIVVLCGTVPLQALFPGAKAKYFRGNVATHPDFPGQRFYAIYHPAYIKRNPYLKDEFQKHLRRLARIARDDDIESEWRIVRGEAAPKTLASILMSRCVSVDIETNGKEPWEPGARITSFTATADARVVVATHEDEPHFFSMLDQIGQYIDNARNMVVAANVGFDVDWIAEELDVTARCTVQCVLALWYEVRRYKFPNQKELVSKELDGYRYLIHRPELCKDPELLLRYNGEDSVQCMRLFVKGMAELNDRGKDLVVRVLGPSSLVFRRMTRAGLYLRQDYRRQKIQEYADRRRETVEAWREEDPEFIPKEHESGKGLKRYLFDIRKLPILAETKTGEPTVDKTVIKRWIREGATYLKHLLVVREIDKIKSTYLTAYDKHIWSDGRIRPSFWVTSTDTSRPSSTEPNVFNIPRASEIRDLFGVLPGHAMLESDGSQMEFRVMVSLAKDDNGIAGYNRGDDAHTMTARAFNPNPSEEDRSNAKPVNFSLCYGGGAEGVLRMARDDYGLNWELPQAEEFTQGFYCTYPRFPGFHQACEDQLNRNRGWFQSVTGHTWFYRDWDHSDFGRKSHAQRCALNAEAQGPAYNICMYVAIQARRLLDERGFKKVAFVNSVYDSIIADVPNLKWMSAVIEIIEEARALAHEWIKPWFLVPLVFDHKVGESWGSLEKWKA